MDDILNQRTLIGSNTGMNLISNLNNKVVTPDIQQMYLHGGGKSELTVDKWINDITWHSLLMPYELPEMTRTGSGEVFFKPIKRVVTTVEQYFAKWFSLSPELKISHDHDYEFARLNEKGFLMKMIITPSVKFEIDTITVKYITKLNPIGLVNMQINKEMDPVYAVTGNLSPTNHAPIYELVQDNHKRFSEIYLQDVQKEIWKEQ